MKSKTDCLDVMSWDSFLLKESMCKSAGSLLIIYFITSFFNIST